MRQTKLGKDLYIGFCQKLSIAELKRKEDEK